MSEKLKKIQEKFERENKWNYEISSSPQAKLGIITCSVSFSIIMDIIEELDLKNKINILKIGTPFPFPQRKVEGFISRHDKVLVIEETDAIIEYQIIDKSKVLGRLTGHIPLEGELTPNRIYNILARILGELKIARLKDKPNTKLKALIKELNLPQRRPTLCAGCPERAAFFSIRKAFPKAIYTSDIGCYTLGLNLKAVDTVLDMGAGITLASGFYQAFNQDGKDVPIVATMGDSTFYHAGTASLVNAVYNQARFILVILDNEITAMTGMQPTPGTGVTADGSQGKKIPLERLIKGCGLDWIKTVDPYEVNTLVEVLKKAGEYVKSADGGIAVIIARHPCLICYPQAGVVNPVRVEISDDCNGCRYCLDYFECPALYLDEERNRVEIDRSLCVDCGVCINACPKGVIVDKT